MKSTSTIKSHFFKLLLACFLLATSYALSAQDQQAPALKEFKILIEKTTEGFALKSFTGSAWVDLKFNNKPDNPQAIDEYGMTKLSDVSPSKNPDYADYLFTITKSKNRIVLKGYEGTAWKELTFILPKSGKQMINQAGMSDL